MSTEDSLSRAPASHAEAPPSSMLGRVLAVLDAFGDAGEDLSLAELSRRTGMAKATVHRITAQMCQERLLAHTGTHYQLGLRLFEIGVRIPQQRTLVEVARPLMEDLREVVRQRIHLAVLDDIDVVYVEILGPAIPGLPSRTGGRVPAHATGVGKAILAYSPQSLIRKRIEAGLDSIAPDTITDPGILMEVLRQIRSEGTAYDHEESTPGISCVAAPVFGADRKVCAAMSITGPTRAIDPKQHGIAVRTAAFTLSRTLRQQRVAPRPSEGRGATR